MSQSKQLLSTSEHKHIFGTSIQSNQQHHITRVRHGLGRLTCLANKGASDYRPGLAITSPVQVGQECFYIGILIDVSACKKS